MSTCNRLNTLKSLYEEVASKDLKQRQAPYHGGQHCIAWVVRVGPLGALTDRQWKEVVDGGCKKAAAGLEKAGW
jgi:hypothetical protein